MEINRHNYEMFFLLYADNELDAAERKVVEDFAALQPDLTAELQCLLQARLSADEIIPFRHKATLYKSTPSIITIHNCEEYFVLYADGELNAEQRKEVDDFIAAHPQQKAELALLQRVKLPDTAIEFTGKHLLYRKERSMVRGLSFQWRRMVAAAAIIATGSWLWMNAGNIVSRQPEAQPLAAEERLPPSGTIQKELKAVPLEELTGATQQLTAAKKDAPANINAMIAGQEQKNSSSIPIERYTQTNNIVTAEKIEVAAAVEHEPASFDRSAKLAAHVPLVIKEKARIQSAAAPEEVKPLILDQAAFEQKDNEILHEAITKTDEGIIYLDTENTERKSKGMFRGLLRKASRFVDHVTNPDINDDKQSVVRIASFEITRK